MQTSTAGSLKEKLKEKLKEDRLQHQELMNEQLYKLTESLKMNTEKELSIIETDIQGYSKAIRGHLRSLEELNRRRVKPIYAMILTPLITLVITCGAAWGLVQYYVQKIESLSKDIISAEMLLDKLEDRGAKIRMATCGEKGRLCIKIDKKSARYGESKELWMIPEGY